jgi:hypothetical protein
MELSRKGVAGSHLVYETAKVWLTMINGCKDDLTLQIDNGGFEPLEALLRSDMKGLQPVAELSRLAATWQVHV